MKTEEDVAEFIKLCDKNKRLLQLVMQIVDSFASVPIDPNDRNWVVKRARQDGQETLISTLHEVFRGLYKE